MPRGVRLPILSYGTSHHQALGVRLWLRKDIGLSSVWTACEQTHLPASCFGLTQVNKPRDESRPRPLRGSCQSLRQGPGTSVGFRSGVLRLERPGWA